MEGAQRQRGVGAPSMGWRQGAALGCAGGERIGGVTRAFVRGAAGQGRGAPHRRGRSREGRSSSRSRRRGPAPAEAGGRCRVRAHRCGSVGARSVAAVHVAERPAARERGCGVDGEAVGLGVPVGELAGRGLRVRRALWNGAQASCSHPGAQGAGRARRGRQSMGGRAGRRGGHGAAPAGRSGCGGGRPGGGLGCGGRRQQRASLGAPPLRSARVSCARVHLEARTER
mmetsp:Transcript_18927/g.72196  ORF Transcript_18927/g.72196 Transcript_18927/m.72196 type:complete len:228 (+) Transcript_18927:1213-1896(+)